MSKQDEFEEAMREADIASCADGEPHVFIEKLTFVNKGLMYEIDECERCGQMTWSWFDVNDRPIVVDKHGKIK